MSSQNRAENGAEEEEGIKVAIRMRPLNQKERENAKVWKVLRKFNSVAQCTSDGNPVDKVRGRNFFTFDKVFGESCSTKELYDGVAQGIVESVVGGLNGTIFAYGQTSSGKTYTMQGSGTIEEGSSSDGGIVHMAAKDIFSHINNDPERVFLLRVSFVEIYNEEVRDLLVSGSTNNTLKIREDPTRGVFVDATENIVSDFQSLLSTLFAGEKHRAFASTAMNERSSRSHTIFRITVESRLKRNNNDEERSTPTDDDDDDDSVLSENGSDGAIRISTLNLVDLAGSESVRHTGATGDRQKEGGMINQSLLTLSQVISKLGSSSSSHINFRDSKLTRLLQPSLSGNARMAVICCATSSELYLEETRSTLQFASRAKLVKTRAQINEVMDDRSLIKKLQRELAEAKRVANTTDNGDSKHVQELQSKATHAESVALKAEEALNRLKAHFLKGGMLSLSDQVHDRKRMGANSSSSERNGNFADLLSPSFLGADKKRRRQSDGILPEVRHDQSPFLDATNKMNVVATLTPANHKSIRVRPNAVKMSSSFQLALLKEALSAKSELTKSLNNRLNEWESMALKYESSLNEAHQEIEELKASKISSDEARQLLAAEKQELESQRKSIVDEFHEQLSAKENAIKEALTMMETIIDEKEYFSQSVSSLEAERDEMEETIAKKENQIESLSKEVVRLSSKIDEMQKSLNDLTAEHEVSISALKNGIEEGKQKNANLEDECKRLLSDVADKDKHLDVIVEENRVMFESLQKENENIYEAKELLQSEKEILQFQLDKMQKDFDFEKQEQDTFAKSLNDEIERLKRLIHDSEIEKRGVILSLAEKCTELEHTHANMTHIETNLKEEIKTLRYSESCLVEENSSLGKVVHENTHEIERLLSQLKSSYLETQNLIIAMTEKMFDMNIISSQLSELQEKLISKESSLQRLHEKISLLEADHLSLTSEFEVEKEELQSMIAHQKATIENLQSDYRMRLLEQQSDHNNLIVASVINASILRDAQVQNMTTVASLEKKMVELEVLNHEANQKVVYLENRCADLEKDIEVSLASGREVDDLVLSLTSQNNELQANLVSLQSEIQKLLDDKVRLLDQESLMTGTFTEIFRSITKTEESQEETEGPLMKSDVISKEFLDIIISKVQDLLDGYYASKKSHHEVLAQNQILLNDLREKSSEIDRVTKSMNEINIINEQLSNQIELSEYLARQMSVSEDLKVQEIEDLQRRININQEELHSLSISMKMKESENAAEVQRLIDEIDQAKSMHSTLFSEANQNLVNAIKSNEDLKASLQRAFDERDQVMISYQQATQKIDSLNDTIVDLQSQLSDSLTNCTVEKQKSFELSVELQAVKQNLDHHNTLKHPDFESQLNELQQLLAASNAREEEARIAANALEEELVSKEHELEEVTLFATECGSALKEAEAQLQKMQTQLSSSSSTSESGAIDEILKEMETLIEEKLEVEKKLAEAENQFKSRVDELKLRFEDEQTELLHDAQERIDQLKLVLEETNIELQRHKDDANFTRSELISLEEQLRSNQTAAIDSDEQVLHLSEQLSAAEAESARLKEELSKLQDEYDTFVSHSNSTRESLKLAIEDKLTASREEISLLKDSLHEQTFKAQSAEEKLTYYDNEIIRLKNEISSTKKTLLGEKDFIVSKLKEELALGKVRISKAEAQVIEMTDQLEDYRDQILKLKHGSVNSQSNEDVHKKLIEVENALKEKSQDVMFQTQLVTTLRSELESMKDTIDKLNIKIESKDERISTLKRKALTKEHVSMIKTLKEERSEYKDLAERYKAEIDLLKNKMTNDKENIFGAVNSDDLIEMQKKQLALEEKLRKYVAHCEFLKKDKMTLVDLIKSTFEEDDSIVNIIDEDLGSAVGTLCERLKSLEDELENSRGMKLKLQQMESKLAEVEGTKLAFESSLEESKEKIKEKAEENKILLAKLNYVTDELQMLKEKKDKLQKISETVQGSVDELEEEKQRQISFLEKENLQFLVEMKKMKQELRKLKAERMVPASSSYDDERTEDLGFLTKLVSSSNKENDNNQKNSVYDPSSSLQKPTSGLGSGRGIINEENTQECQAS